VDQVADVLDRSTTNDGLFGECNEGTDLATGLSALDGVAAREIGGDIGRSCKVLNADAISADNGKKGSHPRTGRELPTT
jgi:hypothetical protein